MTTVSNSQSPSLIEVELPTSSASRTAETAVVAGPDMILAAPGHPYNSRTNTGIKWIPPKGGQPGYVELWARTMGGAPTLLARNDQSTTNAWDYWYSLEFLTSFPQVKNWWFGSPWTGRAWIGRPVEVATDPETSGELITGWLQYGSKEENRQPWSLLKLDDGFVVNVPQPAMSTSLANLTLQMLVAEKILEICQKSSERTVYPEEITTAPNLDWEGNLTSVIGAKVLAEAFPTEFTEIRIDHFATLTPREALCTACRLEPGQATAIA